ncbi:MAG: hypothetical protein B6D44_17415 [Ignavibacteriales bacterium UTCHB2]|jgi:hypothetical protein|nr:MAG: hypothetical protein BWY38_02008 [Ignavibacteria bacterium ADurb.Bin266]OQY69655.1 MAG: hypothetical protein B6D44_17415 [Ignavibacteriales bacterium UTCHB2]
MLKKNKILVLLLSLPLISLIIITILYFFNHLDSQLFSSILWGFLISSLNLLLGLLNIKFGIEKSDKFFLIIVFGGVVFRLFLMLGLIIIALKILFVSLNSFIFTTFIYYFYYLMVEIFVLTLNKNLTIKTRQ